MLIMLNWSQFSKFIKINSAVFNKCIIMQDNEVYKEEWEIRYIYSVLAFLFNNSHHKPQPNTHQLQRPLYRSRFKRHESSPTSQPSTLEYISMIVYLVLMKIM